MPGPHTTASAHASDPSTTHPPPLRHMHARSPPELRVWSILRFSSGVTICTRPLAAIRCSWHIDTPPAIPALPAITSNFPKLPLLEWLSLAGNRSKSSLKRRSFVGRPKKLCPSIPYLLNAHCFGIGIARPERRSDFLKSKRDRQISAKRRGPIPLRCPRRYRTEDAVRSSYRKVRSSVQSALRSPPYAAGESHAENGVDHPTVASVVWILLQNPPAVCEKNICLTLILCRSPKGSRRSYHIHLTASLQKQTRDGIAVSSVISVSADDQAAARAPPEFPTTPPQQKARRVPSAQAPESVTSLSCFYRRSSFHRLLQDTALFHPPTNKQRATCSPATLMS